MKAADIALYLAKSEGRGTYRFHNSELTRRMQDRQRLEGDLRKALENSEFLVYYQPKVLLADPQKIVGYEALLRWRHPERGIISPAEFIPLAEETGLIVQIGEWMLGEVCTEFKRRPVHECVAVNCSPIQFRSSNVAMMVANCIARSGLDPARVEIEITESTLMRDDASTMAQLSALRSLGIRLALDDFGTGFSSLSYLETYPIDCIKIDRCFVSKLGVEARAASIVRAIVSLGAELKMSTIAEGVETQEQAKCLAELGCTMAQGYLYGKPAAAKDLWPDGSQAAEAA
jgi:EAL domain-containing protein (putative c-di-GMP-specific phosphodiesterase class I)